MKSKNFSRGRGFTLIEVLVTLLLVGIVIPAIVHAITVAMTAGGSARFRNDAAQLAKSQLALLLAGTQWQTNNSLSGDFSPNFPQYHWQAAIQPWNQDTSGMGIDEIDLTVSWTDRGHEDSLMVTSLAYPRNQEAQQQ
jgi:prepilin-type N-terminal cleavage/methylation domain-containing protein